MERFLPVMYKQNKLKVKVTDMDSLNAKIQDAFRKHPQPPINFFIQHFDEDVEDFLDLTEQAELDITKKLLIVEKMYSISA